MKMIGLLTISLALGICGSAFDTMAQETACQTQVNQLTFQLSELRKLYSRLENKCNNLGCISTSALPTPPAPTTIDCRFLTEMQRNTIDQTCQEWNQE